jgi:hypothetical protein
MRFFVVILFISTLALTGCDVPQAQKLADCTTNNLDFRMRVQHSPPYQFVLGVPLTQTGKLSFRGEIILRQSTDVVARIPIDSQNMTSCNWLNRSPDLSGYILTWSRTNYGERLSEMLVRKQTYDVHITFDEAPPTNSSLWLSSIEH